MKRRLFALLTLLSLLTALLSPAALAAEDDGEMRWLLPEDTLVNDLSEEELLQGGTVPEEGSMGFTRDPDGIVGQRNILVVPVRFGDEEEFLDTPAPGYGGRSPRELISLSYTGTDISVDAYYDSISFGAVDINPILLLEDGGSLQLTHDRAYYMPYALDNEDGYWQHLRAVRIYNEAGQPTPQAAYIPELSCTRTSEDPAEHVLLDEESGELLALCSHMDVRVEQRSDQRLELVWNGVLNDNHLWQDSTCFYTSDYESRTSEFCSEVYTAVNALALQQGIQDIDCVTLWFSGNASDWSSILWPQQSAFSAWGPTFYRDDAEKYFITLFTEFSLQTPAAGHLTSGDPVLLPETGSLAHELAHMLGFPDYYSYYDQSSLNLGPWSLMETCNSIPQNIHGWACYIYGGWLGEDNVQQISTEGFYTITTLSGATREERDDGAVYLYYIDNPASNPAYPEQIVLEYRSLRGTFEKALYDGNYMAVPGLILYSVDDDAERLLAGNTSATGLDGRYGAKLYYTPGIGAGVISQYSSLSAANRLFYDYTASVLSDISLSFSNGSTFTPLSSYGSPDPDVTENALVSRRTGKNSGIVICNAAIDPEDSTQLTFWVDLDEPEAEETADDGRFGIRTVTVTYDEPISAGPGLADISATAGTLSAAVKDNQLILTLSGADQGARITIPADAVQDQAGRTMERSKTLTLQRAANHAVFSDVPADYWALEAITATADAGLFRGVEGDRFSPDTSLTRAMFVTVLGRLSGVQSADGSSGFDDVDPDSWYAPYVKWAVDNGLVTGTGGNRFSPDRAITRQEMAVLLDRYLSWLHQELPQTDVQLYDDDAAISDWARDAVYAVQAAGLIRTEDNQFLPQDSATRAVAAYAIWLCMQL